MPTPLSSYTASKRIRAVLRNMLTMMSFALLVLVFPGMLYVTSSGMLDLLKAIPNGYQIWHISYYVEPAITLVLMVTLFMLNRAERRHPERERQRIQDEVMAVIRQRQAEHDTTNTKDGR